MPVWTVSVGAVKTRAVCVIWAVVLGIPRLIRELTASSNRVPSIKKRKGKDTPMNEMLSSEFGLMVET